MSRDCPDQHLRCLGRLLEGRGQQVGPYPHPPQYQGFTIILARPQIVRKSATGTAIRNGHAQCGVCGRMHNIGADGSIYSVSVGEMSGAQQLADV